MSTKQYIVEGMTCGGCVKSLTNALNAALPNNSIVVELEGGKVSVDGEHDIATVKEAVDDAGFDFVANA